MDIDSLIASGFVNLDHFDRMYEIYLTDPESIDASWTTFFDQLPKQEHPEAVILDKPKFAKPRLPPARAIAQNGGGGRQRIYNLVHAYRLYGHLMAGVNLFGSHEKVLPRELQLETWGFHQEDLKRTFPTAGLLEEKEASLKEIISALQKIYCRNIGVEYIDTVGPEFEHWLQSQIEPNGFTQPLSIEQKKMILQHLNKSELFESFIHMKYVGQKRFSLEGGETLIPILAAIVEEGSASGIEEFILGMAHRGRLNVLSNIMDKSYGDIFSEFESSYVPQSFEGSGDVKYHKGFHSEIMTAGGHKVDISMTANPSHLESVNPVVEGQVRARQDERTDEHPEQHVVPILVHGDAAIAGQGVVYETMQFCKLPGYETGGTVHIVINNQIGFTAGPDETRSTRYCTDVAHTFSAPVFHVNAEDPEGCIYATNLAIAIRQKFHCDVFIDLICYRKYGHNETDEPAYTQPLEYKEIREKKPIREIYRDFLIDQGVLERHMANQLEKEFKKSLQQAQKSIKQTDEDQSNSKPSVEEKQHEKAEEYNPFVPCDTAISQKELEQVADRSTEIPEGFTLHEKVKQLIDGRRDMIFKEENPPYIDWGMAEQLAFGSLLYEGYLVRVSGQDSCRGTFSHRHGKWLDQNNGKGYFPLQHLKEDQAPFYLYNSPLSEYAALGFEFGYSIERPKALVIWEAQFGDFFNGAQIIVDQYICTAEQKWGTKSNLTLLLPHGYEGQGPEHSSARIERFLTLAGEKNIQVVNPTTPAQLFHLLRRQVLHDQCKPLIVFTPKGLLRHPECVSQKEELINGRFEEVLDDPDPPEHPTQLIFCSGRIFYDLIEERKKQDNPKSVIVRLEQLYPFHFDRVEELFKEYKGVKKIFWAQEEPKNMGAWHFVHHRIGKVLPKDVELEYVGRSRSSAPATGSFALHKKQHREILSALFPPEKGDITNHQLMQRV